jgi:hypothetical protein
MAEECAQTVKIPWYHWHRFAVLPNLQIKKADQYNTWGFSFHWLVFRCWTMDSPDITFSVNLNDQSLNIRFEPPYMCMGLFIPVFPQTWSQKLWRKTRNCY